MTKVWRGETKHSKSTWIITVYEKGRPQNQVATSAVSRGRSPWMPQPAAAQDSTPDWEKDLSKHKGKLYQGSKGDFFPEQRLFARWKNADRSTLLHESGPWRWALQRSLPRSANADGKGGRVQCANRLQSP